MFGSRNINETILISIYKDPRTVYRLKDIALLTSSTNFASLNNKLNYYVRTGKILNPRKGIYAKPDYDPEELSCKVYTPSYISLEYVLHKAGVVFQYNSGITVISYLSRSIDVDELSLRYRKIKGEILVNPAGIIQKENRVNIASAERAFLDLMYLDPGYYIDNTGTLDKQALTKLLPVYDNMSLTVRINDLIENA